MRTVFVKSGHVQPLWAGHPWVFAQAVERIEGGAAAGDEVRVEDARGNFLGVGLYSPGSAIPVRLYSRKPETRLDARFFAERIENAIARRHELGLVTPDTNGVRWIHAEGDGLPGLIVDGFGDVVVCQFGTQGMKLRQASLLHTLEMKLKPRTILDRTSERVARMEGFTASRGVLSGDTQISAFQFSERGLKFNIPLDLAQKTGFYLDQRPLRARVEQLAAGRRVLDVFCYVGAVSLSAARGGASSVHAVDTSALALEVGAECARMNGLGGRITFEQADAIEALQHAGRKGGHDLVICDPPKLSPNRGARNRALEYMKKLSAAACQATRPGGLLILCSCSAAIGIAELGRTLALGARSVGLQASIVERLFQGADHPVPAAFPEGLYLSTLIAEITPFT